MSKYYLIRCSNCGREVRKDENWRIPVTTICWKCKKVMRVYYVDISGAVYSCDFTGILKGLNNDG